MPTSAFYQRADATYRSTIYLVKIDLAANGSFAARSLYLASDYWKDPSGQQWEGLLAESGISSIDQNSEFHEFSIRMVDCDVTLLNRRLQFQTLSDSLFSLLADYVFTGSKITITQAFRDLTSTSDFLDIFTGRIRGMDTLQQLKLVLSCTQDGSWNRPVPPRKATQSAFPRIPDDAIGVSLPIIFGDFNTGKDSFDWGSVTGIPAYLWGRPSAPCPAVIIDPVAASGSAGNPTYLLADHELALISDFAYFWNQSVARYARHPATGGNALVKSNPAGTGPAEITLGDRLFDMSWGPVSVHPSTTALFATTLLGDNPFGPGGLATLDFNANRKRLDLFLPDIQSLGNFKSAKVWVIYDSTLAPKGRIGWVDANGVEAPVAGTDNLAALGSATYNNNSPTQIDSYAIPGASLSTWAGIGNSRIFFELHTNAGQLATVYGIVLSIQFEADSRILRQGSRIPVQQPPVPVYSASGRIVGYKKGPVTFVDTPDVTTFDSPIWTFPKGFKDDGSGTYTGTANALIEHPVDIARYLLVKYGNVSPSEIETAASTFGSFVDARAPLPNYKFRICFNEERKLKDVLEQLQAEGLFSIYKRCTGTGSKWICVPWQSLSGADYRTAADPIFIDPLSTGYGIVAGSFKGWVDPASAIVNSVRVNFDYDLRSHSYRNQVFVTAEDGSTSDSWGWDSLLGLYLRDQNNYPTKPREQLAKNAVVAFGKQERTLELQYVYDGATATSIRNRYFDQLRKPHVHCRFTATMWAADLERGNVIQLADSFNQLALCPDPDSSGWDNGVFRVTSVKRNGQNVATYDIEAVRF